MFHLFGPHRTFHVIGLMKLPGVMILAEKFLDEFIHKDHADKYRRHVQLYGDINGGRYARVECREIEVKSKLPPFWKQWSKD